MDSEPSFIPKVQFTRRYQAPSVLSSTEFLCRTLTIPVDDSGAIIGAVTDALERLLDPLVWNESAGSVSRFTLAAAVSAMFQAFMDSDCGGSELATVPFFIVRHTESQNADGGTANALSYNKHALGNELFDPNNLVTLSGGNAIIVAGTYLLIGIAVDYKGNACHASLYDVTASQRIAQGVNQYASSADSDQQACMVIHGVVFAEPHTIELDVYATSAQAGNGLGNHSGANPETYAYLIGLKMA